MSILQDSKGKQNIIHECINNLKIKSFSFFFVNIRNGKHITVMKNDKALLF